MHESLEEERPKLLKELERLRHSPEVCCYKLKEYCELYTTATKDSQPADISNHLEAVDQSEIVDHSEVVGDSEAIGDADMFVKNPKVSFFCGNSIYNVLVKSLKLTPTQASRLSHIQDSLNSQTEPKEVKNTVKSKLRSRTGKKLPLIKLIHCCAFTGVPVSTID